MFMISQCILLMITLNYSLSSFVIRPSKDRTYYGMALSVGRPPGRPSVHPSTIACERDILKTACRIDFTFWYVLNTTKTSDAIDLGHSMKTKMAATAV